MATSSQKFIARNRAPRVQIEYDVETYGAEKMVQLPFVMGVLADLSGTPENPLPPVAERKFTEVDVDNFNSLMKSTRPRVVTSVPNLLTNKDKLAVDITFTCMADFSPAKVAEKIDGVRQVLEARRKLANLKTYMDGKTGAEVLIARVINDKALLESLAQSRKPAAEPAASASAP
jgi:type VI secretion system protein ImpB